MKKGKFRLSVCRSCGAKAWPPSHNCPRCLSRTSLQQIETSGILLEFASSQVKDRQGIFGIIEMSGIRIVGSFESSNQLREGMMVRMSECGVRPDGTAFYNFVPAEKA